MLLSFGFTPWRQAAVLLFSAFFGFFTIVVILQRVFAIKLGWGEALS
jgi:hypothetical protein